MFEELFLDIINKFFNWVATIPTPWVDLVWPAMLVVVSFTASAIMCVIGAWIAETVKDIYNRYKNPARHAIK